MKTPSSDGTQVAYETKGSGPALILVDGALCYRSFGPMTALAELLAPHFTVTTYDRRGRGESTNSLPYALAREVEDIEALVQAAGELAFLFGTSSGGCLALEAALQLDGQIRKLAIYEAPYNSDQTTRQDWIDYRRKLSGLLANNQRGEAVALFMQFVGTSAEQVAGMRNAPMWPMFEAVAPTLDYDAAAIGADRSVPVDRLAHLKVPALVMNGTSLPFMLATAEALAGAIPHAQHRTLDGQTHDVKLEVLAPELIEFFAD